MHKVNWKANQEFEILLNYKILQTAFSKNLIDKFIDVDRLITARYMDNLEFMQWFKKFFENQVSDFSDYDPVAARNKGKGGSLFFPGNAQAKKTAATTSTKTVSAPTKAAKPSALLAVKTKTPATTKTVAATKEGI